MSTGYVGVSSKMGGHIFAIIAFYRAFGSAKKMLTVPRKNKKFTEDGSTGHVRTAAKVKAGQKRKGKSRNGENPRLVRLETCGLFSVPVLGWGDPFNCIISLRERSQFAKHSAESIVKTFSELQSRQRRIPMSDGRSSA